MTTNHWKGSPNHSALPTNESALPSGNVAATQNDRESNL